MESIAAWVEFGGFVAIMALLWTLRCDMAGLRDRMAPQTIDLIDYVFGKGNARFSFGLAGRLVVRVRDI